MKINKNNAVIFLFFLCISCIISLIWLRPGLMIAAGESGMPFYHLSAISNFVVDSWSDVLLGSPASYGVGNFYFFQFLAILQSFHIQGYLIQAMLFITVTLIGQLSIYAISKRIFPHINTRYHIVSAIFYVFNLAAVVGVWNRLQYPFIIAYALIPLALFLYMKGLDERKYVYSIFINGVILVGLISFTSIPMLELLWMVFLMYSLFYVFFSLKSKKNILFLFNFLILTTVVWFLFNFWWLYQFYLVLTSSSYTLESAYGISGNINTFKTLSENLGNLAFVLRMMHTDFFNNIGPVWNNVYQNPIIKLATFLIPFLVFLPLVLKRKQKYVYIFLGISLTIIFLAKGSSGPLGGVSLFLFSHFRFLEAFRNSFEKFSLIMPLAYAPLIGYSLYILISFIEKKKGRFVSNFFFIIFIGIIIGVSFPMLNRWVFTGIYTPTNNKKIGYYVKVPSNYEKANSWLNLDKSEFRAVALPIGGEGITYSWDYGYSGVESSNGLFDKPFISLTTTSQYLGNIVPQLQYSLFKKPEGFSNLLSILNIKYILVRSDINAKERSLEDPLLINSYLATSAGSILPDITPSEKFGTLQFYLNKDTLPAIYASSKFEIAPSQVFYSDVSSLANYEKGDVILNNDLGTQIDSFIGKENVMLISPNSVLTINSAAFPRVTPEDAKKQLFYPRILPSSPFHFLIRFKENLESFFETDPGNQFFKSLLLSSKRLSEFVAETKTNSYAASKKSYEEYLKSLDTLNTFLNTALFKDNIYYFRLIMMSERLILEDLLISTSHDIKNLVKSALKSLSQFSQLNSVEPKYESINPNVQENSDIVMYNFLVPTDGNYELLLRDEGSSFDLDNQSLQIQIDGTLQTVNLTQNGIWISFGKIDLKKGQHQIQIPLSSVSNLIASPSDSTITVSSSKTAPEIMALSTIPLDPSGQYQLTFDYWLQKGKMAQVGLGSNLEDKMHLGSFKNFGQDDYNNDFQTRSFEFDTTPEARAHNIVFKILPYNDCLLVNSKNLILKSRCTSDKSYYNRFSKTTILQIKNIRLKKIFTTGQALLKLERPAISAIEKPNVSFIKKNRSEYDVSITNANSPYFLVLSQSFHPLWTARFSDTKEEINPHHLVNSYANAWYINRTGNYTVNLQFTPQKYLKVGKIVSFLSIIFCLLIVVIVSIRKKYD